MCLWLLILQQLYKRNSFMVIEKSTILSLYPSLTLVSSCHLSECQLWYKNKDLSLTLSQACWGAQYIGEYGSPLNSASL